MHKGKLTNINPPRITTEPQSALIDSISAHLINEAYPVCYGKDARWANHLYPVYVTEAFCKSNFVDEKLIIKII